MKTIEVTNKVMPVISVNFEEMKADLESALEKFGGIEVTEYNLPECVAVQRELSGVRSGIDKMRLEIKKEVSAPIAEFEGQMKELFSMVVDVEKPIKDGLEFYEDIRKKEALAKIEAQIKTAVEDAMIRPEFANIEIDKRWLNKTVRQVEIDTGIADRIEKAVDAQETYDSEFAAVEESVNAANSANGLKLPLPASKYTSMIGLRKLPEILSSINGDAARQKAAESAAVESSAKDEQPPAVDPVSVASPKADAPKRTVTVKVTGTDAQMSELSGFMQSRGIEFEKIG